jgi:sporulation protein YlmC with PRC-barrel domain
VIRLSEIQRMEVVDQDGERLGRIFDVQTERGRDDEPPRLRGFLIGRGGLARRLGIGRGSARLVPVEEIVRMDPGRMTVERKSGAV